MELTFIVEIRFQEEIQNKKRLTIFEVDFLKRKK